MYASKCNIIISDYFDRSADNIFDTCCSIPYFSERKRNTTNCTVSWKSTNPGGNRNAGRLLSEIYNFSGGTLWNAGSNCGKCNCRFACVEEK